MLTSAMKTEKESKWYRPSDANDWMNYVRVVILTEDDATIYINLLNPKDPDFQIRNNTTEAITAIQSGGKIERVVPPQSHIPFVFDNLAKKSQKITLKGDGKTQTYSVKKINKKLNTLG